MVAVMLRICLGALWLLTIGLFLSKAVAEPAAKLPMITIAAEDNWPPFSDERARGLSKAIVSAAYKLTGYQINTISVPYARALRYTQMGKVHACWNVTRQQSTLEKFLFHQTPLFKASSSFYYFQQKKPFQSISDIPDRAVVGVILGYEYGDAFEEHKHRFQLVEVSTHQQLLALLTDQKLDVAIFFDTVLANYLPLRQQQEANIIRGETQYVSEIFVAFHRDDAQNLARARALDEGLRLLKKNGEYAKLLAQFGVTQQD